MSIRVLHRPTELHPIEDEGAWDLTTEEAGDE